MLMDALSISMKNSDSLTVQASHSKNCIIRLVFHKERSLLVLTVCERYFFFSRWIGLATMFCV